MWSCKESRRKAIGASTRFGQGYKINIQKFILFLYTSNEQYENERKNEM